MLPNSLTANDWLSLKETLLHDTPTHLTTPQHTSLHLITPHHYCVRGATTATSEEFSGRALRATLTPPRVHRKKTSLSARETRVSRANASNAVNIWASGGGTTLRRATHRHCVRDLATVESETIQGQRRAFARPQPDTPQHTTHCDT